MLWNLYFLIAQKKIYDVLILVFVEYTLVLMCCLALGVFDMSQSLLLWNILWYRSFRRCRNNTRSVSILVIVEYTLVYSMIDIFENENKGLNPCFCGIYSGTLEKIDKNQLFSVESQSLFLWNILWYGQTATSNIINLSQSLFLWNILWYKC